MRLAAEAEHYTYCVAFSAVGHEYADTVAKLASMSWLAKSQVDALLGISPPFSDVVADMVANGEPVPESLADREFSGRLHVWVLPQLHRMLSTRAAEREVSLNRYTADRLSSARRRTSKDLSLLSHDGGGLFFSSYRVDEAMAPDKL